MHEELGINSQWNATLLQENMQFCLLVKLGIVGGIIWTKTCQIEKNSGWFLSWVIVKQSNHWVIAPNDNIPWALNTELVYQAGEYDGVIMTRWTRCDTRVMLRVLELSGCVGAIILYVHPKHI